MAKQPPPASRLFHMDRNRRTLSVTVPSAYDTIARDPSEYEAATRLYNELDARYERRGMLGTGGMGEVELLYDRRMQREVAAKFQHIADAQDRDRRERFLHEARIQGQLEHPSIVPVHEVGMSVDGRPYFTMKRIRGVTLRRILSRLRAGDPETIAKFSLRRILTGFKQVCLTVGFAHARGVIHRDLKPANIMLGDFGETYVLDWGVARVEGDGESQLPEIDPQFVGSPGYMAPEQIANGSRAHGRLVDVYALGAILFEILSLEPLHPTHDREAALRSTLENRATPPSARAPGRNVPPELDQICLRATAFVPRERFDSALALHDAIEDYLDGERNIELRQALADAHTSAAQVAARDAVEGKEDEEEVHRSRALSELGQALALDPGNAQAAHHLSQLMLAIPRKIPSGVVARLEALADRTSRYASRLGGNIWAICFLGVPLEIWMGVRNWPLFIAAWTALALATVVGYYGAFAKRRNRAFVYFNTMLWSILGIVLHGSQFGPLFCAPMWLAFNATGFALVEQPRFRHLSLATVVVATLMPSLLELAGVLPSSYAFRDGMMCIVPRMLAMTPTAAVCYLLVMNIGMILGSALFAYKIRTKLDAAQERLQIYAWHLGQLVSGASQPHERVVRPADHALNAAVAGG